ncbi:MAG: 30S ribosomal protein S4 [Eubacteriales bacterium]|nr:30S ribosomal protein S4 [Eubacteriales bacterium]MDY3940891.1 30S ribosomal protein S4 [Eubacteriales bacterium]
MARYTGPSCKLCRREGKKLFLKGDRCLSDKCAVARRATVPGQHGAGRKTIKEYGLQHREKMTARRYYGVQEKQFHEYYVKADKKAGVTGENMLTILECRLDNIVYRMGLASSRKEARQMVRHAHFTLNGKKVDIPSIICKVGDVVALREKSKASEKFKMLVETSETAVIPKWLEIDHANATAKVIALPKRDDIDFPFEEQLIVELYSK